MNPFLKSNLGWIVTMILGGISFVYSQGVGAERFAELKRNHEELGARLEKTESTGTAFARENRWITDQQQTEIMLIKSEIRKQDVKQHEMLSDIRIIAEWVKEQKSKQSQTRP